MPCDQIRLCQVDFKVSHPDILKAAMKAMGWTVHSSTKEGIVATTKQGQRFSVNYKDGQATVPYGAEGQVDAVKREYAFQLGKKVADRFGWAYKRTGQNSFVISRRS